MNQLYIPKGNSRDVEDIPEEIRNEINFVQATNMDAVLNTAFSVK